MQLQAASSTDSSRIIAASASMYGCIMASFSRKGTSLRTRSQTAFGGACGDVFQCRIAVPDRR